MTNVEELAQKVSNLDRQSAGELASMLNKVFGFKYRYVSYSLTDWINSYGMATKIQEVKVEEPTEFAVILESFDPSKRMTVIKEIKTITGLGLVESKNFVDALPKMVKNGLSKESADQIVQQLTTIGAVIKIQ